LKLLDLAERYKFWIIEDDYDHDFHYDGSAVFPIASIRLERVIYLSSLSKVLSVGLRIGYVVAPKEVLLEMLVAKSLIDKIGDPLLEKALAEFINDGELLRHVNKMRLIYKKRRDLIYEELKGSYPLIKKPLGGMALWLPFENQSYREFSSSLAKFGIEIVPEDQMNFFKEKLSGTRIGFAGLDEKEIKLLATSLRKCSLIG
jgi:GntR family transcriptional regulator/MocR family aminotransferase